VTTNIVLPTCFRACGLCEQLNADPSGAQSCQCVAHCWRGNLDMCDTRAAGGWTHDDPTVVTEEWSAGCQGSLFEPLPGPVKPCSELCSSLPYAKAP